MMKTFSFAQDNNKPIPIIVFNHFIRQLYFYNSVNLFDILQDYFQSLCINCIKNIIILFDNQAFTVKYYLLLLLI